MLLEKIQADYMQAFKAQDKTRAETLRFLIADIKKYEIDTYPPSRGGHISEDEVMKLVKKQVKNREESIAAFTKGGRQDLVDKEAAELAILKTYVPQEMSDEDIMTIVEKVVAGGAANFGQAMGLAMKEVAGRAGGDRVAKIVKQKLGG